MVRGEGDVILRMPVFRRNLGDEGQRKQVVDSWCNVSALVNGEGAMLLAVSSALAKGRRGVQDSVPEDKSPPGSQRQQVLGGIAGPCLMVDRYRIVERGRDSLARLASDAISQADTLRRAGRKRPLQLLWQCYGRG
jgi:hypothetical protein